MDWTVLLIFHAILSPALKYLFFFPVHYSRNPKKGKMRGKSYKTKRFSFLPVP